MFFVGGIIMTLAVGASSTLTHKKNEPFTLFAKNEHIYWQALVDIANNKKELALAALKSIDDKKAHASPQKEHTPPTIHNIFDTLFLTAVKRNPELLTTLGLFETIGVRDHNAYLTDISLAETYRTLEDQEENLRLLKAYDPHNLSPDDLISYKTFLWKLQNAVDGKKFLFHDYKDNQMENVIIDLTTLLTEFHTLKDALDVEQYISRLAAIAEHIDQAIEYLTLQEKQGILLPRFAVEKMLRMFQTFLPETVTDHIYYTHLANALQTIDASNKKAMLTTAENILRDKAYPAFTKLKKHFSTLLSKTTSNNGVWALPQGDEYYRYMLKLHTTTDMTPHEVHELGIKEVERIQKEIRHILTQEGIKDETKTVGTLLQELSKNRSFYFPNTDQGRKECLAGYEAILQRSRKELGHLFDLKPSEKVKIQRVPESEEIGRPQAYYYPPSITGSRPGIFFVNLRNMDELPTYSMQTLTIHEAEPGHHFQLALQNNMPVPVLRKIQSFTAYDEGWALYAEKLAYEAGFFSDSFAKIGHLHDELLRAARLVVDTGIHYKRWTREQAIDYMKNTLGQHHDTAEGEVDRYFVIPGQACAYKIGQLKILELRQRAKDALKEKFDIKTFHNALLKSATMPLAILEEVVDNYIKEEQARP